MDHIQDQSLIRSQAYINGQWVYGRSSATFDVVNPATETVLVSVRDCGSEDVLEAIAAAKAALPAWRSFTAHQRAEKLQDWYWLIKDNKEDLARLMTLEQGKPLAESRGEIDYAASFIQWFAEEGKRIYGDIIPTNASDRRLLVIKQPVGVVGAITPWNFPSAMLTRKLGAALAAGCTVVAKPASETPLSALALAELAHRAGIPAGVINVVSGTDAESIGQTLTQSPDVAKITFTGSTAVGKWLMKASAETVKKLSLELGGNAPVIIFADGDIERAVDGFMASKFRNAGQTCICANRLLVEEGIYSTVVDMLRTRIAALSVGNGLSENTDIGPLISGDAVAKVRDLIVDALDQGARASYEGNVGNAAGHFLPPTLLVDTTPAMKVFQQEIFGPVAAVYPFKNEQQAIELANNTRAGLAAYCYTNNLGRIWRLAEALEYGMVGMNEVAISNAYIPFGGVKESGIGREGSKYGIDDYLDIKHICLGGLDQ